MTSPWICKAVVAQCSASAEIATLGFRRAVLNYVAMIYHQSQCRIPPRWLGLWINSMAPKPSKGMKSWQQLQLNLKERQEAIYIVCSLASDGVLNHWEYIINEATTSEHSKTPILLLTPGTRPMYYFVSIAPSTSMPWWRTASGTHKSPN